MLPKQTAIYLLRLFQNKTTALLHVNEMIENTLSRSKYDEKGVIVSDNITSDYWIDVRFELRNNVK